MFCDNVSYRTDEQQNCNKYCGPKEAYKQVQSFNYIPTEQSERNTSNFYKNIISGRSQQQQQLKINHQIIHERDTMDLINENNMRERKKIQAIERNKNLSAILSIILAFSQRIQALKQKLCGYPAQNFSPTQFFNVLDLTQKSYVDMYDIKRFVSNENIRDKDIISLFKRVNGFHSKDNSKLSYFGFLNLIKPYFNEQLARDLLLRDTGTKNSKHLRDQKTPGSKVNSDLIEPTQESVLLLFQQLMLLHCICSSQHEQAKQLLMNEYMLNTLEIKQILGLDLIGLQNKTVKQLSPSKDKASRIKHKSPLSVMYEFVENNSQFEIDFSQMRFLLSFLNCHQFTLINDKYLSLLFLPTNCKNQILKQLQKKKDQLTGYEDGQNHMNTYLTKQNLMNRGNIQSIKNYLDEKANYSLSANHMNVMSRSLGGAAKANFLEFVHPRSIQRVNIPYQDPNTYQNNTQQIPTPHSSNEHPQFQINPSNKYLSQSPNTGYNQLQVSQKQFSNSSSIPQQNIKVTAPRESLPRNDYITNSRQDYLRNSRRNDQIYSKHNYEVRKGLNNEFYEHQKDYDQQVNVSKVSNTPFLEKFMKRDNILKNYQKEAQNQGQYKRKVKAEQNAGVGLSEFSDSAFEVIDYGYESSKINHYNQNQAGKHNKLYADQSRKLKKETLDSRYNKVISQYKNKQVVGDKSMSQNQQKLYRIDQNSSYSRNPARQNQSYGPKFEKSINRPGGSFQKPVFDNSKGNYIDNVGLSQSNVVNDSNLLNRFSMNGENILNQFFKK